MERTVPELLAPAGDFDALVSAVQNGADAVYLGGKSLNARRGAGNFDSDGMKRAADYLHERGKKMYVTVNTVVKQSELSQLEEIAKDLAQSGADAAIVQDFGVCHELSRMLPTLKLHASTQMAVSNPQGAAVLKERGFARVVLAREMSLEDIAKCRAQGIEVEVFCHGALCVACSGLCLFSSLVGGRSGNRGACAQPCRLPYELEGANRDSGYLLSTKDLMTADSLDSLAAAGISSLKIEGRLKRSEYVATVTRIYRKLLDGGEFTKEDDADLKQIFNRGGFTRGYAFGIRDGAFISKQRPSHWGVKVGKAVSAREIRLESDVRIDDALVIRGNDETPVKLEGYAGRSIKNPCGRQGEVYRLVSEAQMEKARSDSRGEHVITKLHAKLTLVSGSPAEISVTDGVNTVSVSDNVLESSVKTAFDAERVKQQLAKTGGTPYEFDNIEIHAKDNPFVPVSAVNALRRNALEKLGEKRIASARETQDALSCGIDTDTEPSSNGRTRLVVQSHDTEILKAALEAGADECVYFPKDTRRIPRLDGMFLYLPPVLDESVLEALKDAAKGAKGIYISNISHQKYDFNGEVRYDFPLNIANEPARRFLNVQGSVYTPSVELTAKEIVTLGGKKEIVVYGRLPLMHLRHCPLNASRNGGEHTKCRACDACQTGRALDDCRLVDRKKAAFPLKRIATDTGCIIEVLNSVPINLAAHMNKLPDADGWRLIFTDESVEEAKRTVRLFDGIRNGNIVSASDIEGEYTTGHYFRGVE